MALLHRVSATSVSSEALSGTVCSADDGGSGLVSYKSTLPRACGEPSAYEYACMRLHRCMFMRDVTTSDTLVGRGRMTSTGESWTIQEGKGRVSGVESP
jgi:hypothetical protein